MGGIAMTRSMVRMGLIVLAALGPCAGGLFAQDGLPPAMVAPAVRYEPAHPASDAGAAPISAVMPALGVLTADSGIQPASFQPFNEMPVPATVTAGDPPPLNVIEQDYIPPPRFWVRGDALVWWVKNAPMPTPLVTTGNPVVGFPTTNTAGAIGSPGTQVLVGGSSLDYDAFIGGKLTVGGWLDDERTIGVEANAFLLERKPYNFGIASDSAGSPPIYLPRFNPSANISDALPIADPLRGFAGNVNFYSSLQLWGGEANLSWNLIRQPGLEFTLLGGFRYASLSEGLQLNTASTDVATGNLVTTLDNFGTYNQFYGGQIGGQVVLERYGFSLDATAKVAFGATQQVVDVQGSTTQFGPNPLTPPGLGTFPGGFYAESSNIGRRTGDSYSVIPSIELNLSYQVTHELRVFVGYTFMYWTNVVRPGDQISSSVNTSQNAVLTSSPTGSTNLVGPPTPSLFNRTDFFAHGINAGLEFRF